MKAELVEQASKIIPEPQMLINVVSRRVAHPAASRKTTSNNTFPLLPFRTGIPYGIISIQPGPGLPARGLFILLPFVP